MALGCFLWVSGICFLLFGGSLGLPAIKGYGYPYISDSRNIGDDAEDEALMSHDWQASNGQPSATAYASNNKLSAARQPASVATRQTVPSAPAAERIVNSESRDWGQRDANVPMVFPLSRNYKPSDPARPQPGPSTGSNTLGGGSRKVPSLVFEDVFQYSAENAAQSPSDGGVSNTAGGGGQAGYVGSFEYSSEPSFQNYPANAGGQWVATSANESPSSGKTSYQTNDESQDSPEEEVSLIVSEPILPPPPPPSSYIIQSRNGYQRVRYLFNKSRYSPVFAPPLPVRPMAPERRKPAAPVGVKNPQRT
ncbi:uncharacterized protein [Paralichthys olivaceus]|uniref:uncharacterized protein n=1 Tax=Paralichthys olivaceus TaxID=8255 RepID=UPI00097D95D0|nr:PREDICTED: uncharacterized protein LOC109638742 [Paralichthys olivaceus]